MKKPVIISIGLVLTLAYCTSNGDAEATNTPAPTVTVTAEAPAPVQEVPAPTEDQTALMVQLIREADPWYDGASDAQIIDTAQLVCDRLREGYTIDDVAVIAEDTIGIDHLIPLVAGAVTFLCTDQAHKIETQ